MRLTFVILHYITLKDTFECVQSIKDNLKHSDYDIVIVENGSPNSSSVSLQDKYQNDKGIHLIISKENLGFAKGNNLGYDYAKKELNSDFIVLLNNDTIIEQADFIDQIIEKYRKKQFHVLGPDIVSLKDGGHQNPSKFHISLTTRAVKKLILKNKLFIFLSYLGFDLILKRIFRSLSGSKVHTAEFDTGYSREQEDVLLHGACFIFSPDYVKRFNGLYSKTFLYAEENILFYIAQQENLKLLYSPDLKIFHREDSSTTAQLGNSNLKRRKGYQNTNSSLEKLRLLLKDSWGYINDLKAN